MRCPNCGAENAASELYCSACGSPLQTDRLSEAEQLLVQKNTAYYGRAFSALRGGRTVVWNWAAFAAAPFWAAYRRMTLFALAAVLAIQALFWFGLLWLLPALMVLCGLFGNWIYYRRVQMIAAEMENQPPDAQAETCRRRGGVTPGGVVLAAAALLLLGAGMRFFFHGTAHLLYPRG